MPEGQEQYVTISMDENGRISFEFENVDIFTAALMSRVFNMAVDNKLASMWDDVVIQKQVDPVSE